MKQVILMLYFTFSTYYLIAGFYILNKDKKAITNVLFFFLYISSSLWALGYAFLFNAQSQDTANLWRILGVLGWCFFYSFWLDFTICIKNNNRAYERKRLLFYIPSLIFFLIHVAYSPNKVLFMINNGWSERYPNDIFQIIFRIYYIIYSITGIIIIYIWGRNSKLIRVKKQSKVLVLTSLIGFTIGIVAVDILPIFFTQTIPLSVLAVSTPMIGAFYAITKYKMMSLTPKYMSEYIFKYVNNSIFFTGTDFHIENVNDTALEMTGYTYKEIKDIQFNELIKNNTFNFSSILNSTSIKDMEVKLSTKSGNILNCLLFASVIYDEFGDMLGIAIILEDISERKKAQELLENYNWELENKVAERTMKLEEANKVLLKEISDRKAAEEKIIYMGYYDELTGVPNRRYFNEYMEKYIEDIKDKDECFAVMFLDLDNFKFINDTYGHRGGDSLLKQMTDRMKFVISEKDLIARIGGDEFLVLVTNLPEVERERSLILLSNKIMGIFDEPFLIDSDETFMSTSIGIALYPVDGEDGESLISNADISMYEAKKSNKNNVKICTPEIKRKMVERTNLRNGLYRALDKGELMVYYQPQVDINSGEIIGFEALLRWNFNSEKFISPVEFIPLAEETGLIVPIGYWVIDTACMDLKKFHSMGFSDLTMAINLSSNQLNESNFVEKVIEIVKKNELEPSLIEFEITERITLNENESIKRILMELKNIGFKISIDDFGTDYSSFLNLKTLPIDKIKIAMEFIQGLNKNVKDDNIVTSIIGLSQKLGLTTIAEGVETREQLEYIKSNRCKEVQGYFFYKPMPYLDVKEILLKQ